MINMAIQLNIYLVRRTDTISDDQYSEFVVIAPDADTARKTHPSENPIFYPDSNGVIGKDYGECYYDASYGWVKLKNIASLIVTRVGTAAPGSKPGVICSSFNSYGKTLRAVHDLY